VNTLSEAAVSSCGKAPFSRAKRPARVGENGRVTLFVWPLALLAKGLPLMSRRRGDGPTLRLKPFANELNGVRRVLLGSSPEADQAFAIDLRAAAAYP
jgi:hypothetical protein